MNRIILLIFFQLFWLPGNSQKPDYQIRANQVYENITRYFRSADPELFVETTDTSRRKNPYSYLWPICALFQAANELESIESGKNCLSALLKTINRYFNASPPAPGYQAYVSAAGKDTRYYDDNQWIGITAIDAYNRTKQKEYLDLAETIYTFMMTGCDTVSGGGIYWREGDLTTKNTCSNGPGIILALRLYMATHRKEYLNAAEDLYNWVNRYLRSPVGIYYDALKVKSMKIDSATYTYNTGTRLQSNLLFYRITSDSKYLDEARLIAASAEKYFYRNNRLPNDYWFNAVLLRGFMELAQTDGNYRRLKFFADDAERIWSAQRDEKGLIGRRSGKTLIDQAAMVEIFARLAQAEVLGGTQFFSFTGPR